MTALTLHLLRHGAPETPRLLMGRTDGVPVADGIADCLAQTAALRVNALVCSDLVRAARPAKLIALTSHVPLRIDPRWRELDFGDWDGLSADAIDREACARFWDDPENHPPPNGERWSSLVARVSAALADITQSPALVVTHGGAMRAALSHLCGFAQRQAWAFDLPYGTLLTLKVWPGERPSAQIVKLCP